MQYIAEAISTPFNLCPDSVVKARDHIQYLCESALGKNMDFNELLSVAYAVSLVVSPLVSFACIHNQDYHQEGQEMNVRPPRDVVPIFRPKLMVYLVSLGRRAWAGSSSRWTYLRQLRRNDD
jgi:hypothetical protein